MTGIQDMTGPKDMAGKVAFVSGSATGIGKASAMAFAARGCAVALADLDEARGEANAAAIRDAGGNARFYRADMTDDTAIGAVFEAMERDFGGLDYAHNNVGFSWGEDLLGTSAEEYAKTVDLCLKSPFLAMQREIALMQKRGGGAIVNTASMAGVRYTPPANAAYSCAKAGVIHLTAWASSHHAKDNIASMRSPPALSARRRWRNS